MALIKRIDSTGSALRRKARLGLSILGLLAMALAGMAFWSTAGRMRKNPLSRSGRRT